MSDFSIDNLTEFLEKIEVFLPKLKPALSGLKKFEQETAKKNNLTEDELLLPCISFSSTKVFFLVLKGTKTKEEFSVNGINFPKGCLILSKEIFKIELMQFVTEAEQKGLVHFVTEYFINQKLNINNLL